MRPGETSSSGKIKGTQGRVKLGKPFQAEELTCGAKNKFVCVCESLSHVCLCDPVDCSLSVSSVHGILQARILEWVAISSSRGSSPPRDRTWISYIAGGFFITELQGIEISVA